MNRFTSRRFALPAAAAALLAGASGAREHAPLELRFAREKYSAAQSAMAREDHGEARRMAEQAIANARLAEAKADAADARAAAQEVRKGVEALRRELLRMEEEG